MVTIFLHILKYWVQILDQRLLNLTEVLVVFRNATPRSLHILPNSFTDHHAIIMHYTCSWESFVS